MRMARLSWWGKLQQAIKDDLLVKVYIPVATFVASVLMRYEIEKSIFNVLVAFAAMILWAVISATFLKEPFHYKE